MSKFITLLLLMFIAGAIIKVIKGIHVRVFDVYNPEDIQAILDAKQKIIRARERGR